MNECVRLVKLNTSSQTNSMPWFSDSVDYFWTRVDRKEDSHIS